MKKLFFILIFTFILFSISVKAQINTYPFVENGDNPVGWNVIQSVPIWSLGTSTINPAGVPNDAALICNFWSYAAGPDGYIVSPVFDFTSLSHPVVHFYVAYTSYDAQNDSLQFLVSTDFGNTFVDVPAPYRKSYNQSPSLATVPSQNTVYTPLAVNHWRHETVDLGAFAGQNYLLFALRGVCAYGNNLYIDNFVMENADTYSAQNVTSAGNYQAGALTVSFNTIGLSPSETEGKILNDNPGGGILKVSEHLNQDPVPSFANPAIKTNTTATTQDGSVFTPNKIAPDKWYTVSYSGNDRTGNALYDVSIDLSSFTSFLDINKVYIVKRADYTGSWECLNTVVTGNSLKATGLSTFSDFAVAGDLSQKLVMKFYLEGFFNGNNMIPDTAKLILRTQVSPYPVVDISSAVLNSAGEGIFSLPNAVSNTCYYFEVQHRNHVRVFSHSACEQLNSNPSYYDFTDAASKTFDMNSILISGTNSGYAAFTGDVNQDDIVDIQDYALIENDAFNFVTGYVRTDLNGDGIVGIADLTYCDNNALNFIGAATP
ncbi:MAG: choice-of-anchor J domain-containing protein [Bacteroidetes bacterium]|nr:choice-of-anchor J domain-containing protein [Bacteroidota bacterium]